MKLIFITLLLLVASHARADDATVFINCDEAKQIQGAQCPSPMSPSFPLTAQTIPIGLPSATSAPGSK